jgi:predicted O-linked N-acetylglucosamine transferase (SPINDLY family)
LNRIPNSVLWLLRFPAAGEHHLLRTAQLWAGPDVASRVIFTDVSPKDEHLRRARVADLVLDTVEVGQFDFH